MEETEYQHAVFLELRQRLQSGILFIRDSDRDGSGVMVLTRGDSALDVRTPFGTYHVKLSAGVRLIQTSCSSRSGDQERGCQFHLQLNADPPQESCSSVVGRLVVRVPYRFCCCSCGTKILQDRSFQRVLPLPNGNWNALVEDWCCHPDPFANLRLLPREHDCLLSDTYVLLSRDPACQHTLTVTPITPAQKDACQTVCCRKCSAELGEQLTPDALKLYITEIFVDPPEDGEETAESLTSDSARQRFLEKTLAARLVELSSAQSVFRFSVQSPRGKPVVLLWLLNSDTLVGWIPAASASDEAVSCQTSRAVKVLYIPCSDTKLKDVTEAWARDISVHPLPLPLGTCEELQTLLRSSTIRLPAALHNMNSYQVAYLRL